MHACGELLGDSLVSSAQINLTEVPVWINCRRLEFFITANFKRRTIREFADCNRPSSVFDVADGVQCPVSKSTDSSSKGGGPQKRPNHVAARVNIPHRQSLSKVLWRRRSYSRPGPPHPGNRERQQSY